MEVLSRAATVGEKCLRTSLPNCSQDQHGTHTSADESRGDRVVVDDLQGLEESRDLGVPIQSAVQGQGDGCCSTPQFLAQHLGGRGPMAEELKVAVTNTGSYL